MKAIITKVTFDKEVKTQFGLMFQMRAFYNDKQATFLSKSKEKTPYKIGEENEFNEIPREYNGNTYYNIKPIKQQFQKNSNYGKNLKREQSRYSGFAVSYVKDLIMRGVLIHETPEEMMEEWKRLSTDIFNHMVELDKSME